MSTYGVGDYKECLARVKLDAPVRRVVAVWGGSSEFPDGDRETTHNEWSGGFLLELTNGRFAYVTGWCDYTGWG